MLVSLVQKQAFKGHHGPLSSIATAGLSALQDCAWQGFLSCNMHRCSVAPVQLFCSNSHVMMVRISWWCLQVLLENGASIELQDALGRSALMFAAGNNAAAACKVCYHSRLCNQCFPPLTVALLTSCMCIWANSVCDDVSICPCVHCCLKSLC